MLPLRIWSAFESCNLISESYSVELWTEGDSDRQITMLFKFSKVTWESSFCFEKNM